MRRRVVSILLLVFAILVVLQTAGWAQCVMCRTALESSTEGKLLASGFRSGIFLLGGAPYAMVGTIGYVIFRAYRKKKKSIPPVKSYIP